MTHKINLYIIYVQADLYSLKYNIMFGLKTCGPVSHKIDTQTNML